MNNLNSLLLSEASPVPSSLNSVGTFRMKTFGGTEILKGKTADGKWEVEAQVFSEPSYLGINAGRISRLFIYPAGSTSAVVSYERAWVKRPSSDLKALVRAIVTAWPENLPDEIRKDNKLESDSRLALSAMLEEASSIRGANRDYEEDLSSADIQTLYQKVGYALNLRNGDSVSADRLKKELDSMGKRPLYGKIAQALAANGIKVTEGSDAGCGKSAVRKLRAEIRAAEEDMTPDIGKNMGRPDLGAYGRRKGEAIETSTEIMSVADYKRRWMSGHEAPGVKQAEKEGKDLRVTIQYTPFGKYAIAMEPVAKGTKESAGPAGLRAALGEEYAFEMGDPVTIVGNVVGKGKSGTVDYSNNGFASVLDKNGKGIGNYHWSDLKLRGQPTVRGVVAKESALSEGTELWKTRDGKWWLLGTVTMTSVTDKPFASKQAAVDFGIKNGRWNADIRDRLMAEPEDGVGSPGDFQENTGQDNMQEIPPKTFKQLLTFFYPDEPSKRDKDELIKYLKGLSKKDLEYYYRKAHIQGESQSESDPEGGALSAECDRAEEDMTPEIGAKLKRPDLGKYGGKKEGAAGSRLSGLLEDTEDGVMDGGQAEEGDESVKIGYYVTDADDKKVEGPFDSYAKAKTAADARGGDIHGFRARSFHEGESQGVEAYGVSGTSSKPFRKIFKTRAELDKFTADGNNEIQGMRPVGNGGWPEWMKGESRKHEGQSISFKNKDAFRALYDKGVVHTATDNAAFTRKPAFDTLAADVEVSDNPEGTVTFRSKDGKKFISIDQHPEKAYGYKKESRLADEIEAAEDMLTTKGADSALKKATDVLPRRNKDGKLILQGEDVDNEPQRLLEPGEEKEEIAFPSPLDDIEHLFVFRGGVGTAPSKVVDAVLAKQPEAKAAFDKLLAVGTIKRTGGDFIWTRG